MLPCDLHVLSYNADFSINRIHRLLEEEFCDVKGLEPFNHPLPASRVYHSMVTANTAPIHCQVRPLLDESYLPPRLQGLSAVLTHHGLVRYTW